MSGIGITALLKADGEELKKNKCQWTRNQTLNRWKEAKDLLAGRESVKDFLLRINTVYGIIPVDITSFNSNHNIVSVSGLYERGSKATVVFVKTKGSLSLLTIGSKTLVEFLQVGLDYNSESKVPFFINGDLESVNLFLENYV